MRKYILLIIIFIYASVCVLAQNLLDFTPKLLYENVTDNSPNISSSPKMSTEVSPQEVPASAVEQGKQQEIIALETGKFQLNGIASYYGKKFHQRLTANGETYNMYAYTAAHKTLPFNTVLEVTNINNNQRVFVRINDRGPYLKNRVIDLSYTAAESIGMIQQGTTPVSLKIIHLGEITHPKFRSNKNEDKYNFPVTIQIASYANYDNANRLYQTLVAEKLQAKIETDNKSNTLYRVVLSDVYPSDIDSNIAKLTSLGYKNVLIRKN